MEDKRPLVDLWCNDFLLDEFFLDCVLNTYIRNLLFFWQRPLSCQNVTHESESHCFVNFVARSNLFTSFSVTSPFSIVLRTVAIKFPILETQICSKVKSLSIDCNKWDRRQTKPWKNKYRIQSDFFFIRLFSSFFFFVSVNLR